MKDIKQCVNFRELGGYTAIDNRVVVSDKLFRSGNLNSLNDADWQYFKSLSIKDVIDFRSLEEKNEHPYTLIDNVNYHDCVALHTAQGLENFYFFMLINEHSSCDDVMRASQFVREGYLELPFNNNAFAKVFELMLESDDGILFHCSSGKDRTGIMAALILKALNVDDETIIKDYLISNDRIMKNTIKHAEELGFTGEVKDTLIYCCSGHRELLESSFNEILKRYNDWNEYFEKEYQLDEKKLKLLRDKFLRVKEI